jgi:hypothetical protein
VSPGDSLGRVLLDGDEPVGFLAYVHGYLPRPDGSSEHVCNLSTWVVEPAYSSQAVSLLVPALAMTDVTLTNLTAIPSAHGICSALGFQELDAVIRVLRPAPLTRSRWRARRLVTDIDRILPRLPDWERRIAADHRDFALHALIEDTPGDHCYVIFTMGRRRGLRTARVHWVTPGSLERASLALRRALLRRFGAVLVEMDDRLAPSTLPGELRVRMAVPRLFRSDRLARRDVPAVYSELVLLGL